MAEYHNPFLVEDDTHVPGENLGPGSEVDPISALLMALRLTGISTQLLEELKREISSQNFAPSFKKDVWQSHLGTASLFTGKVVGSVTYDPVSYVYITSPSKTKYPELQAEPNIMSVFKRSKVSCNVFIDLSTGNVTLKGAGRDVTAYFNKAGDVIGASHTFPVVSGATATPYRSPSRVPDIIPKYVWGSVMSRPFTEKDANDIAKVSVDLCQVMQALVPCRARYLTEMRNNLKLVTNALSGNPSVQVLELDGRLNSFGNLPRFMGDWRKSIELHTTKLVALADSFISFKSVRVAEINFVVPSPRTTILNLQIANDIFRNMRGGPASDATKFSSLCGGSNTAGVVRKQFVPLRMLGFIDASELKTSRRVTVGTNSPLAVMFGDQGVVTDIEDYTHGDEWDRVLQTRFVPKAPKLEDDGKRYLVGCGDSNIHYVAGLSAIMMDVKAVPHARQFICKNALEFDFKPADQAFSDAYCKDIVARTYWATEFPDEYNFDVHEGESARAGTSLDPFELTFCFAHRFMKCGLKAFSVKVHFCNIGRRWDVLVDLFNKYHVVITLGGRVHNGEVYLTCFLLPEEPVDQYEREGVEAIVLRYAGAALASNIHRYISELRGSVSAPKASFWKLPTTYTSKGVPKSVTTVGDGTNIFEVMWPTIRVTPTLWAALLPVVEVESGDIYEDRLPEVDLYRGVAPEDDGFGDVIDREEGEDDDGGLEEV